MPESYDPVVRDVPPPEQAVLVTLPIVLRTGASRWSGRLREMVDQQRKTPRHEASCSTIINIKIEALRKKGG